MLVYSTGGIVNPKIPHVGKGVISGHGVKIQSLPPPCPVLPQWKGEGAGLHLPRDEKYQQLLQVEVRSVAGFTNIWLSHFSSLP